MVSDTSSAGSSSVTPMLPDTSKTTPAAAGGLGGGPDGAEVGHDPLGQGDGLVDPAGDEDGELVAAEPGDQVAVAHGGAQPGRDLHEQVVPGLVAGDVVDRLEPVEVQQQEGGGRALGGPGAGVGRAPP